jgi:hypothetical protein
MKYNIAPVVKFYVAEGFSQQGALVDFSGGSGTAGVIDFTSGDGQGKFGCTVTQDGTDTFTAKYFAT